MPRLIKRFVDGLLPVAKDTLYRDDDLKGFALRVKPPSAAHPKGARTWVVQYRNKRGRTRKIALGAVGVLTAEEARRKAKSQLGRVADGEDPSATRGADRRGLTVAALCDIYMAAAKKGAPLGKRGNPKSALTIATDRGRMEGHIKPLLGSLLVKAVTRADVKRFHDAVQQGRISNKKGKPRPGRSLAGGAGAAARTVGLLGGIFSFAVDRGDRADNPVAGVKRRPDRRRMAVLAYPSDYRALGAALFTSEQEGEDPRVIAAIRLLALTGCRRGEVVGLTSQEVNLEARVLRLSNTKEGYSVRPLGQPAADLLNALIQGEVLPNPQDTKTLFAGKDGKLFSGLQRGWQRVARRAGLVGVTLHTLRHSFATAANALGCSEPTIAAMLGHSRGTVTARYIHVVDGLLIEAADLVAGAIANAFAEGARALEA